MANTRSSPMACATPRGVWDDWSSWSPAIRDSDIRRWALAVYWPETPPRRYLDQTFADSSPRRRDRRPGGLQPLRMASADPSGSTKRPRPDRQPDPQHVRRRVNGGCRASIGCRCDLATRLRRPASACTVGRPLRGRKVHCSSSTTSTSGTTSTTSSCAPLSTPSSTRDRGLGEDPCCSLTRLWSCRGSAPDWDVHWRCAARKHGARVVLVARSSSRLDEVARTIDARGGVALPVPADATSRADVDRVVWHVIDRVRSYRRPGQQRGAISCSPPVADIDDQVVRAAMEGTFATAYQVTRGTPRDARATARLRSDGRVSHISPPKAWIRRIQHGETRVGRLRSLACARTRTEGIRVNTLAPGKIAGERLESFFARGPRPGHRCRRLREALCGRTSRSGQAFPSPTSTREPPVALLSDLSLCHHRRHMRRRERR